MFRNGEPFDAFDGRNLDPNSVLAAMFGQTDGLGLTGTYGLEPTGSVAARPLAVVSGDPASTNAPTKIVAKADASTGGRGQPKLRPFAPEHIKIVELGENGPVVRKGQK